MKPGHPNYKHKVEYRQKHLLVCCHHNQEQHQFLSPEWEVEWKKNLNFPNIKHAIQFTDDKARAFLAKNPSPDNNIDADKVSLS